MTISLPICNQTPIKLLQITCTKICVTCLVMVFSPCVWRTTYVRYPKMSQQCEIWLWWLIDPIGHINSLMNLYRISTNVSRKIDWRIISGHCVETGGIESEQTAVLLGHVPQSGGLWKSRSFQQAKAWGEAWWRSKMASVHDDCSLLNTHCAQQAGLTAIFSHLSLSQCFLWRTGFLIKGYKYKIHFKNWYMKLYFQLLNTQG